MKKNTAILIFANSAEREGLNKPFSQSAHLFKALNTGIQEKTKKTNLPYYIISETQQFGNTFGERFTNAIESIFKKGFDNIITVGNDTPHLNTSHILEAQKKLETNSLVLGPSQDGGFYLMGINKSVFNAKLFVNLPWQSSILNQHIFNLFSLKKVDIACLETLIDIDNVLDIKKVINSFKNLSINIRKILLKIITSAKAKSKHILQFLKLNTVSTSRNKGSPIVFSI